MNADIDRSPMPTNHLEGIANEMVANQARRPDDLDAALTFAFLTLMCDHYVREVAWPDQMWQEFREIAWTALNSFQRSYNEGKVLLQNLAAEHLKARQSLHGANLATSGSEFAVTAHGAAESIAARIAFGIAVASGSSFGCLPVSLPAAETVQWTEFFRKVAEHSGSKWDNRLLQALLKQESMQAAALRREANIVAKTPDADRDAEEESVGGMTWQEAQAKLDTMRLDGKRFTSYAKLAKKIGCVQATVYKAINEKGTVELQEWAAKQRGASRLNAAPEMASAAFDSTPQARERDPANITEDGDVDAAMDYLIEQAEKSGPEAVARLRKMPPDERRQLAETAFRDPDLQEQIERRRGKDRKRRD